MGTDIGDISVFTLLMKGHKIFLNMIKTIVYILRWYPMVLTRIRHKKLLF
jgi:hypothetical protein